MQVFTGTAVDLTGQCHARAVFPFRRNALSCMGSRVPRGQPLCGSGVLAAALTALPWPTRLPRLPEARGTELTHFGSVSLEKLRLDQAHSAVRETGAYRVSAATLNRAKATTTGAVRKPAGRPLGRASRAQQSHRLTCDELLVLNDRDVSIETWKIKKVGPGNPDLVDVRALPVVETAPRGQHQHPLLSLQQGLQEGGDADVDVPAEVEPLWGVDIVQKVPGREEQGRDASARRLLDRKPGRTRNPQLTGHPGALQSVQCRQLPTRFHLTDDLQSPQAEAASA